MLSLVNNMSALTAENNLSNANNSLNTSLQRLSSGLQINSGADNPAGLVISQEQQAQMSGLQSAITNTSNATNVVQTADGALNETNSLLLQIRGLAVSAANVGANDPNTLAADQAQIANALQTISSIATSTQYGNDQLLNGSHAVTASLQTSSGAAVQAGGTTETGTLSVALTGGAASGTYTATITSLATQGTGTGSALTTTPAAATATGTAIAGSDTAAEAATVLASGQYETLTINGTAINLSGGASGLAGSDALTDINSALNSAHIGVTASFNSSGSLLLTSAAGTAGNSYTVTDSGAVGTGAGTGLGFSTSPTTFSGGTSGNVLDAGQSETLTINGTAINLSGGASGLSDAAAVTAINAKQTQTGVQANFDSGTGEFTLTSVAYGSAGNVAVVDSGATGTGTGTGLGLSGVTALAGGADVAGTMTDPNSNAVTVTGLGNVLSGGGLSITTDPTGTVGTIAVNVGSGATGTMSATASTNTASGTYTADITQLATQATLEGTTDLTGQEVVGANETDMLTINGVQIQLNGGVSGLDANGAATAINQYSNQTGVKASVDSTGGQFLKLTSVDYGSAQNIAVEESGVTNPGNSSATIAGVGTGGLASATLTAGQNVAGTLTDSNGNTYSTTGIGNTLTAANGLSITTDPNGSTGDLTTVVTNNSMLFQIGADAGQTASLAIQNVQANAIGTGVTNSSGITSLSEIDVTNSNQSSADILSVIDQAISQVSNLAGTLGSFQDNTLQATASNLQSSLQNTTAANSTIRDTDFASESANYAQDQVLVQAGTQVLKDANQLPQLALTLLQ